MANGLTNLTQLQSALLNQHRFNSRGELMNELMLISQGQELVNEVLSVALTRMNSEAVTVSDDVAARAAAAAAENALRQAISAVIAERTARMAAFNAIPGYGEDGYGLSQNDFTDALKELLESAVPEAPTADGRYVLEVSGGVASWQST